MKFFSLSRNIACKFIWKLEASNTKLCVNFTTRKTIRQFCLSPVSIEIRVQHHTMLREKKVFEWRPPRLWQKCVSPCEIIYGILSKFLSLSAQRVFFKCCATIVSFVTSSSTHSMSYRSLTFSITTPSH